MEKNKTLPIDRLSYSSLIQLLRNPMIFKLKEILGVYDSKSGVSAMIGSACHKALQLYYGGEPDIPVSADPAEARAEAMAHGLKYLTDYNDEYIDYGKTGSREEMLKGYAQAMDFYWKEEPHYHEVLMCEKKLGAEMHTIDGDLLPLPGTGRPDLVVRNAQGEVEIVDTKFVKSFTDYETEDYIKIIQSQFMYHLVKETLGEAPKRMLFREVKRSANKDGSPQIRDWAVPYDHKPYFVMFYNLYKDAVRYLQNDPIFLPNLSDMFDGEHAGMMYAQGLINADMTDVEVMHKVKDVAFVSKKFVASNLERAENKHLLPEEKIKMRLAEFGVPVEPVENIVGAQITQYRFKVSAGVRMSTIQKHKADIERTLAVKGEVRVLTPVPGTEYFGVEIENETRTATKLTKQHITEGTMAIPIGLDVNGELARVDLPEMPHLLIAGATGSGKSVMLATILTALTKQMTPEAMHLALIDPKRVELTPFGRKPHLHGKKVISNPRDAIRELLDLKKEMEKRYKTLEKAGKRDIQEFNDSKKSDDAKLPYLVTVIDEFADLMLQSRAQEKRGKGYKTRTAKWLINAIRSKATELNARIPEYLEEYTQKALVEVLEDLDDQDIMMSPEADVEYLIARIAQLGRASGIHLIIATQRPSVDVVTGLIKANFPTRIAFRTSSPTDSAVILGEPGAEKLTGKGDMLLMGPMIKGGKVRLQGLISK